MSLDSLITKMIDNLSLIKSYHHYLLMQEKKSKFVLKLIYVRKNRAESNDLENS